MFCYNICIIFCLIYRERYIPVTRKSIIRYLVEQEKFFNDEEKKKFEEFALALDSAIVNKYHGVLQELKVSQLLPFFLAHQSRLGS